MAATGRLVKLHLPEDIYAAIEGEARRNERTPEDIAAEMLSEAVKMRQVPGIVFVDGARGRVARVGGTGLDVWEIVGAYRAVADDWQQLQADYPWLSEQQLRAALAYAAAYPQEIAERLQREAHSTPETVWSTYPFTRPPGR
jgi:uncharacterized protein (DUF433 family)